MKLFGNVKELRKKREDEWNRNEEKFLQSQISIIKNLHLIKDCISQINKATKRLEVSAEKLSGKKFLN